MTPLEIVFAVASVALQAAAVVTIAYGIYRMGRASDQREKREDQRHDEAMTALRALVAGLEKQGAALEAALKGRA